MDSCSSSWYGDLTQQAKMSTTSLTPPGYLQARPAGNTIKTTEASAPAVGDSKFNTPTQHPRLPRLPSHCSLHSISTRPWC